MGAHPRWLTAVEFVVLVLVLMPDLRRAFREPKLMLKTRFPVRFVVVVVGLWLIAVAYLAVLGVPTSLADSAYSSTSAYQMDMSVVAFNEEVYKACEAQGSDCAELFNRYASSVASMGAKYRARFVDDFTKYSVFGGIVLIVVLLGNWLIHRYDKDPFGWRKG